MPHINVNLPFYQSSYSKFLSLLSRFLLSCLCLWRCMEVFVLMNWINGLLTASHYDINIPQSRNPAECARCELGDSLLGFAHSFNANHSAYLKPTRYWYLWCLLATLSVVLPVIAAAGYLNGWISLIAATASMGVVVCMFLTSLYVERVNKEFSKTPYWFCSPLYLSVRRKRTWYPFFLTSALVYGYIFISLQCFDGGAFKSYRDHVFYMQIFPVVACALVIYFVVTTLASRSIFKQVWIDVFLNDLRVPEYVKEMLLLRVNGSIDIPPSQWRYKEEMSKLALRTAVFNSFFSTQKKLFIETIPFRFIVIFMGAVSFPYFALLIMYACFGLNQLPVSAMSPLCLSSVMWVAGSFSFCCHMKDMLEKDGRYNKTRSHLQMPFLRLIGQQQWLAITEKTFCVNGWKLLSFLLLSLVPYLWSFSNAMLKQSA